MSSSTADDSHSPPADVNNHRSIVSFKIGSDDETEEEHGNRENENVREHSVRQDLNNALRSMVKLPETELLGFENENVKSGVTDVTSEFTVMSSTSSPPADVHRSTVSFKIGNEDEHSNQNNETVLELQIRQNNIDTSQNPVTLLETDNLGLKNEAEEEEYADQNNENVRERSVSQDFNNSLQNPVKLPEIDILGLENDVKVKSKSNQVPISSNRIEIEDNEHKHEHEHEDEKIYDFPPGLSTLNVNGRPKFELVTVRENGRLQMFMVPNLSPQLVRSPGRNGRLKMWLLNDDQLAGDKTLPPVRRSI